MKQKSLSMNAILNTIRTVMSMVFPLITFPYAARVLQVTNLGKVNFSSSVISYFVLLAGLGIKTYAIREGAGIRENKKKLEKFASQVFTINLISTALSYALLIITMVVVPKLHQYTLLLMVQSINILGATIGVEWLYSIYEDYLYITIRSILVQLTSMILLFLFVRSIGDYVFYAAITVFATNAANLINFIHARKTIKINITPNLCLTKHIKPVLIIFAMSVATTIYVNSDTTMLGFICDDYHVGIYNAATKIYTILKNMMAASILVALPRLSYYLTNGLYKEYNSESKRILNMFLVVLLPTVCGLFMVAREIIYVIAGTSYIEAVPALQILSICLLVSIFSIFLTNVVLLPGKKEKQLMYATIVSALVNVLLNFIFIPLYQHTGTAFTTLISEVVVLIWQIACGKKLIKLSISKRDVLCLIIGCVSIVAVCSCVDLLVLPSPIKLVLKIIFSVFLYLLILIIGKHSIVTFLKKYIRKK